MKVHLGQHKSDASRCGSRPSKEETSHVPSWVPPAWKIPLIDRDRPKKNEKGPRDGRKPAEQPVLEIDERIPVRNPGKDEGEDGGRGVVILDLG